MTYTEILKLLSLALAPCIAVALYFFFRDRKRLSQAQLALRCFLLGGLALFVAVMLHKILKQLYHASNETVVGIMLYAFVNISLAEEFAKFFFLRFYAYRQKEFVEPYDGIMYSVMISMGFAALENVMYVFIQPSYYLSVYVGSFRMITAIPLHASVAIIMGYFVGLAKFEQRSKRYLWIGLLAATIMHGAYDYFIFRKDINFTILGAVASLGLCIYFSIEAVKEHASLNFFLTKRQRRRLRKQQLKNRALK